MNKDVEVRYSLRLPESSMTEIKSLAEGDDRSINWEIVQAVKEYIARRRRKVSVQKPEVDR